MTLFLILFLTSFISPALAQTSSPSLHADAVAISSSGEAIGFDDLVFSPEIHKVLVPAGKTGKIYLIDPVSSEISSLGKLGEVSSADEGYGYLFAVDHSTQELKVLDVNTGLVVAGAKLSADADFVRYVGFSREVWVTEPHKNQLEIFKLEFLADLPPLLHLIKLIQVNHGPESLVIDHRRGNAYSNLGEVTAGIDLVSHHIVDKWVNGCEKPRGNALDDQRGLLFVSCAEGKVMVFDLNEQHKKIGSLTVDPGVDVIGYNPRLSHLYVTSSKNATLSVLEVSVQGDLSLLSVSLAVERGHCVVGDDQGNIWVCDPQHVQLLRYKDM